MKYKITIDSPYSNNITEALEWCYVNIGWSNYRLTSPYNSYSYTISFIDDTYAMAFKLVWVV